MSHELEFLPAALEIQEKPPSPAGRAIAWSVMAFFSIAVLWALFGKIDIVATAQGKIIPSGRVKVIQPMEIGVVRRIHVHEGRRVEAGDLLIELDPTSTQADLGGLEMELDDARLEHARYRQLAQMTDEAALTLNPLASNRSSSPSLQLPPALSQEASAEAIALQEQMLRSEWSEHLARGAAQDNAIESRQADLAATRNEVKKLETTLPLITRRTEALKSLVVKQLGSQQVWLELEEERVAQQQDLASQKNRIKQVEASIREAKQQRQALESEFRRRLLTRLSEAERRINQLEKERVKAAQRTKLQHMTAPVSGVVQQLAVHTIGGVVTPAQELMKIVPESENLEVEAWILNKDIGFVAEGQIAEIKIETFPFTRYGTIDAEIIDVSNDAVTDEEKGLVYAGRVLMKQSVIQVGEKQVKLTPGMAVTVEVKTGKRRLIEFIMSPLLRYKEESMGER
ncbi:hemolysin D [Thiogranum longum]|uniref:Membrane fusion protein (MFP) family protein n=1 Tax=Thiogranum longum TaxID=1537524 RepID=A0A4R1HBA0_9GAMM|nr:HlyD family type I secretion periplasmic adaptor subunit [Thiogranum longum]TCK19227.1 hemolysin D [Thiogranum longum]